MKWTPIQHVTGFLDEGYRVGIERNFITGCRLRAKFATMDIKAPKGCPLELFADRRGAVLL
jgi:hypothetical protein